MEAETTYTDNHMKVCKDCKWFKRFPIDIDLSSCTNPKAYDYRINPISGDISYAHCRVERKDWGLNYIGPYNPELTFDSVIRANNIDTVAPNSYHFGQEGHSFFYRFMLQYIIDNKFI